MFTLRRWWDQNGLRVALLLVALSGAWALRQTQAAPVFEAYRVIVRPFQASPLREEVLKDAYTQELEQRIADLESQNLQLQELLGYVSAENSEGISAPVIGRSADHWWQQIVIGRGTRHGIQEGSVVIGTGGLMGRVTQVTPNTSRVLLISDPTSRVGVTISRSRSMGYVRGQSENRAVMEFFDKVPDVRAGDLVVTSTYSQLFPPGLTVGQIESVNLNKSPAPEAVVTLSAPINIVEWVMVYENSKLSAEEAQQLGIPRDEDFVSPSTDFDGEGVDGP
jgi:rod shape-determining protein MreC